MAFSVKSFFDLISIVPEVVEMGLLIISVPPEFTVMEPLVVVSGTLNIKLLVSEDNKILLVGTPVMVVNVVVTAIGALELILILPEVVLVAATLTAFTQLKSMPFDDVMVKSPAPIDSVTKASVSLLTCLISPAAE